MLEHITQTANSVYARAITPSQEGVLRTEQQQHTIPQKPPSAVKQEQAERVHEQRIEARREQQRELTSYRANNETPTYSPKHSQSQASQLAEKLLEAVRQSRQEQAKVERQKEGDETSIRQSKLDRAYQPTNLIQQPRFVDEMA